MYLKVSVKKDIKRCSDIYQIFSKDKTDTFPSQNVLFTYSCGRCRNRTRISLTRHAPSWCSVSEVRTETYC